MVDQSDALVLLYVRGSKGIRSFGSFTAPILDVEEILGSSRTIDDVTLRSFAVALVGSICRSVTMIPTESDKTSAHTVI